MTIAESFKEKFRTLPRGLFDLEASDAAMAQTFRDYPDLGHVDLYKFTDGSILSVVENDIVGGPYSLKPDHFNYGHLEAMFY